jgi:tetratricopeptide (TPR) repeat protein
MSRVPSRMFALLTWVIIAGGPAHQACSAPSAPADDAGQAPADEAASAWGEAVAELDERIAVAQRHAERYPNDWAHLEAVARLLRGRAGLSGRLEDYLEARDTLDRAFVVAGGTWGPLLERASLAFTLHQLPVATQNLDLAEQAVLLRPGEKEQIIALRGDVALHSGRYEEALARFVELHERDPHPGSAFRLALYHWKTGDLDTARRWLAHGEATATTPRERAWLALQLGLTWLDEGNLDAASAAYARADDTFPGWWLIEEHRAEVAALQGDPASAERRYRDLIARTGNPEFMDALAELVAARDPDEACALIAQAGAWYARWLTILPEATYGHALDHLLDHGEPAAALDLAERNHALRPGGDATTRLARALLKAGRCADARAQAAAVLATPWRTPELRETVAAIDAGCGAAGG